MLEIIVVAVVAAVVPSLALYSLLKKQLKSSPLAVPAETEIVLEGSIDLITFNSHL